MMEDGLDLTVSVVVYQNSLNMLRRMFKSILTADLRLKLFVIDNSPTVAIEQICCNDSIFYIFNRRNVGFGAGHNMAIRKAAGLSKYHLIINPDIYFEPGTLEKIYQFMEKNPDIGLLMPRVLYPDGSLQYLCRLLPTPLNVVLRRFRIPFLSCRSDHFYELKFADHEKIIDAPYLSGCFMFVRNDVFSKIGMFDERFFMYFEDVDLSRRIHHSYRTVYYPHASIYHNYEKGSSKDFELLQVIIRSGIRYYNKWGWVFDKERKVVNKKILQKLFSGT